MKVNITELSFYAVIGILPFERTQEQLVRVNCSFHYNYSLGNFIDYSSVAQTITTSIKQQQFELLEEAVLHIKKELKKLYGVKKIKLRISKPTILDNCVVEVGN